MLNCNVVVKTDGYVKLNIGFPRYPSCLPTEIRQCVFEKGSPVDLATCAKVDSHLRNSVLACSLGFKSESWTEGNDKVEQFLQQKGFKHILDCKSEVNIGGMQRYWPLMSALTDLQGQERLDMLSLLIQRGGMLGSDVPEKTNTNEALDFFKRKIKEAIYTLMKPNFELNIDEKIKLIDFLIDTCGIEDLGTPPLNGSYNIIQALANNAFPLLRGGEESDVFGEMLDFIIMKIGKEQCRELYFCTDTGVSAKHYAGQFSNFFESHLGITS